MNTRHSRNGSIQIRLRVLRCSYTRTNEAQKHVYEPSLVVEMILGYSCEYPTAVGENAIELAQNRSAQANCATG